MKITCPHCQVKNDIEFANHIKCKKCQKSFQGYSYSRTITKPIMARASALLVAGGVIGYTVENSLDQERYSPKFEYAIMNRCAKTDNKKYLSKEELEKKIDVCSCALVETIKEVGYKKMWDIELEGSFKNNLSICRQK